MYQFANHTKAIPINIGHTTPPKLRGDSDNFKKSLYKNPLASLPQPLLKLKVKYLIAILNIIV